MTFVDVISIIDCFDVRSFSSFAYSILRVIIGILWKHSCFIISRVRVVASMCSMLGTYRGRYNCLSKANPCLTCYDYDILRGNLLILGTSVRRFDIGALLSYPISS